MNHTNTTEPSQSPELTTLKATIGTQEYSLRVAANSSESVNQSITMVSERFNAILNIGKISNPEKIAVMVALNIAMELNLKHQALEDKLIALTIAQQKQQALYDKLDKEKQALQQSYHDDKLKQDNQQMQTIVQLQQDKHQALEALKQLNTLYEAEQIKVNELNHTNKDTHNHIELEELSELLDDMKHVREHIGQLLSAA